MKERKMKDRKCERKLESEKVRENAWYKERKEEKRK
jgi:hypothetical protein